jgi:hypothetical protein
MRRYHKTEIYCNSNGKFVGFNVIINKVNYWYWKEFEDEAVSEIMADHINEYFSEKIQTMIKTAYNMGWKDAKSKNAKKKTWFDNCINVDYSYMQDIAQEE